MSTLKRSLIAVAALALIGGLVTWGVLAHRDSPRWKLGEEFTSTQGDALLRNSLAGLDSAAILVHIQGRTDFDLEGAVALTTPKVRAALRLTAAGLPQTTVVRIIGRQAWVQTAPKQQWARTSLDSTANGWAKTVLSQIAGGIDLHRLFEGASLGIRAMKFKGDFTEAGVSGGVFTFTINALAVRELLPQLLTQQSAEIRTRVPAAVWLDDQGRLLRFETKMNEEAVAVTITGRNPTVKVNAPSGPTIPLSQLNVVAPEPSTTPSPTLG
ncbi:hypothetical protein [Nocardioides sp.]|uniref:hypothetical protein n=1 Tax=Nocardioides sp. TaxID=35761 RepID=UPI002637CD52|nr:hypothetical protein [Nocardioides sp.]